MVMKDKVVNILSGISMCLILIDLLTFLNCCVYSWYWIHFRVHVCRLRR